MKKILAISGSNRQQSIHTMVLNTLAQSANDIDVVQISEFDAPLYNLDIEEKDGIPASINAFIERINQYDSILIATPEHNGNIPVSLKNVLDWASRQNNQFFANKTMAVLSISPGARGGIGANQSLAQTLPFFGATVADTLSIGSFYDQFNFESMTFNDSSTTQQLQALAQSIRK